jgi:hypothetical protein
MRKRLLDPFNYRALTAVLLFSCLLCPDSGAKETGTAALKVIEGSSAAPGDLRPAGSFGVAQAGTTWIGWVPGAYDPVTNPHSIGLGGYWDFDDRGTRPCPVQDHYHEYLKNGAYAQGWTSEDVFEQCGLYWGAEDFSDPAFSCQGNAALNGTYSAWCGLLTPDPSCCFQNAPGYGHRWNQWLCRYVTNPTALQYTFKSNTETGFDYAYVIIDKQYPDSCGWAGVEADTVRCYSGANGPATETFDLTNLPGADPDFCEDGMTVTPDYSGYAARICFVVVSDGGWDDEDGVYSTCDGAFTVDDVIITTTGGADTTTFETGTLEGWTRCGGFSPGDYVAVRDRSSILNNDVCGFDNCEMSGCILTYFNPAIPGQYGLGGHYAGLMQKRAWTPTVNVSGYLPRGYVFNASSYADMTIANWIFVRYHCRYVQDPDCPTGAWSPSITDGYVYYYPQPVCGVRNWGFSNFVPPDADSVKMGYSVWNGCVAWETTCTNGNDTPALDNVRLGIWDLSAPLASMRSVDNYTDAFPEAEMLGGNPSINRALIDIASNQSQEGYFLRTGDSAHIALNQANLMVEFCFRIVPGPGTDTADPWFIKYGEVGMAACDTSGVHCCRMDTAFTAGNGVPMSPNEYQVTLEGHFAAMIHEEDAHYVAEGEEILPDSLFTPGSKVFYSIRTSYLPGPGPYNWLPFGADPTGGDVSSWYEVMVLPDQCKDPAACLLYVDYYNRGAQRPIEDALALLGRTWDRFDYRAESSHQGNGIGNRLLGPNRYRLERGPIGPSLDHLEQYRVMLVNNGHFETGVNFSDGGTGTPDDPTNDVGFLDEWISEGPYKGLWLSGDNIASDFAISPSGPKNGFLRLELATDLAAQSYREESGHSVNETCRLLFSRGGRVINEYSALDSMSIAGSGCPRRYNFDCLIERDGESGHEFVSLMYDRTDITHPPGLYASVDHIYRAPNTPFDSVRTKIDGFSLHSLRMNSPPCGGGENVMIALWMRDVLGGNDNRGYFYDSVLQTQYCPPVGPETVGIPGGRPGGGPGARNALFQNYPNPFGGGGGTTIHYSAARPGAARIHIFDAAGRLVRTIPHKAVLGDNYATWDGKGEGGRKAPSGVYFYEIEMDGFSAHKKMLLVR